MPLPYTSSTRSVLLKPRTANFLAFDAYYSGSTAKTVCLYFEAWTDTMPLRIVSEYREIDEGYEPGALYKRELPGIVSLLKGVDISDICAIIVDGFTVLDDDGKLGLGGRLYEYMNKRIPVIGVAKNDFFSLKQNKKLVYRGASSRPLYITALGIDPVIAAEKIRMMAGDFRIPTLLKTLDAITRAKDQPNP